jgi:hypothetical protein
MEGKKKVLENRVRRTLERRGYWLEKSRARDKLARTYGRYWVWESYSNTVCGRIPTREPSRDATVTLEEIADWLDSMGKEAANSE